MSENCPNEGRLVRVEIKTDNLADSFSKVEGKLDLILSNVSKIAVLEMHHAHHTQAFERAFNRIEGLETKTNTFESFMDGAKGMSKMALGLWGAFGSSLIALIVYAVQKVN